MGTKAYLAPRVALIVESLRPGIALDAFSGMCAVSAMLAERRHVWASDTQVYAAAAARAVLTYTRGPDPRLIAETLVPQMNAEFRRLVQRVPSLLRFESKMFTGELRPPTLLRAFDEIEAKLDTLRQRRELGGTLFLRYYANAYFGVRQAVELDAISRVVRREANSGRLSPEQRDWALLAAGIAAYKTASTTGHFAQYLTPSFSNALRLTKQRSRSLGREWLVALRGLSPVRNARDPGSNRTFNCDSLDLLEELGSRSVRPAVVYADPPYTADHYSRYYHILDTIMTYRTGKIMGKGRYPEGRYAGPFSHKSGVVSAFHRLVSACARIGADLVISYPSNGILQETGEKPSSIIREYYSNVRVAANRPHEHSTLGASKGVSKHSVRELIYVARGRAGG